MAQADATPHTDENADEIEHEPIARRLTWSFLTTTVAALAVPLGLTLSGVLGSRWPESVAMIVALVILWLRFGASTSGKVPATASSAVQFGVIAGLAYFYAGRPDWLIAVLAVLVSAAAVVSELSLSRLTTMHVPLVSNMPGLKPAPPSLGRTLLGARIRLAALAAAVVAGLIGLPAWVWLIFAAIMMVYPVAVLIRGIRRIRAGRLIRRSLRTAVAAYAPEFVVYTSRPDEAEYQILMWLPYLRRTGRRFVIVARTNTAAAAIAAGTSDPVITCRDIAGLDDLVAPTLRVAFYVNASSGNGAFVRYKQLTHIYLGHGDSDKPPSYNPTHAMYDQIFAAGPAAVERYADHGVTIAADKFRIVGRPQVEDVQTGEPGRPPRTVLYAPTWRGHVAETLLYSLPVGERIVTALLERGMTVIFRPHPFSHDFGEDAAAIDRITALLRADAASTGRRHVFGPAAETEIGIIDCINASDAMVSDVSSVVSDYLFSEKPFAMVAVPCPPDQFVAEYPISRASYVIEAGLTNLAASLDEMLGADPLRPQRLRMRAHYLGAAPAEGYSDLFVHACIDTIDRPAEHFGEAVDDTIDDGGSTPLVVRLRAQFAAYGRDAAFAGLALLTVLAAGSGSHQTAGIGALAVIGLILLGGRRAATNRVSLDRLVGTVVACRALMAVTLLTTWFSLHGPSWPVGSALAVLVVSIVLEVPLSGTVAPPGAGAANLPLLADPRLPRMPAGVLFAASTAALVVGWLTALLGGSGLVIVVAAALVVVPLAVAIRDGLATMSSIETVRDLLPAALEAYRPTFAVYFGSSVGANYQVGMWLPYFKRIGSPFIIVTRTRAMLRDIARLDPQVPVIFRPSLRSLEEVVLPTMTTAFYVNNAVRNTHFIERRELTHVWLNHGDSEKPACYNPVHAIYDILFVAGQAGIDRYARHHVDIPAAKFRIVGRPQVELIQRARGPIGSLPQVTVLYAPTWKGPYADSRVYSLPVGPKIVAALLARPNVRVIFRAHPFNEQFAEARVAMRAIGRLLAEDRRATGREHLWGPTAQEEMSVEDCFNASDAMVADVSAVVSDYLKSEKPFSMVAVGMTVDELTTVAPAARAAYVLRDDLTNLDEIYGQMLGSDPLAAERRAVRIYYLGDLGETDYTDGFLDAARAVIAGRAIAPETTMSVDTG